LKVKNEGQGKSSDSWPSGGARLEKKKIFMVKVEEFYRKYFNIDSTYKHQITLWEQILSMKFPLLLKALTGSGKTEAILAPFLSQFINNRFHIAPRTIVGE